MTVYHRKPLVRKVYKWTGVTWKISNEMCDKIAKLTAIQLDVYLPSEVETIMGTAYNKIRKVNLYLRKNQAPKVHVILSNDDECPISTEGMSPVNSAPGVSSTMNVTSTPSSTLPLVSLQNPPISQMVSPTMSMLPQQQYPCSTVPLVYPKAHQSVRRSAPP